jgi:hypothetical protein
MQTMAPKSAGKIRLAERILLAIGLALLVAWVAARLHASIPQAGPLVASATPRSGAPRPARTKSVHRVAERGQPPSELGPCC